MKTTKEVAKLLKLAIPTVIKHAQNLKIKKFGANYVFADEDIEKVRERIGKIGRPSNWALPKEDPYKSALKMAKKIKQNKKIEFCNFAVIKNQDFKKVEWIAKHFKSTVEEVITSCQQLIIDTPSTFQQIYIYFVTVWENGDKSKKESILDHIKFIEKLSIAGINGKAAGDMARNKLTSKEGCCDENQRV
jgi:hypothetical protein